MKRWLGCLLLVAAVAGVAAGTASAQKKEKEWSLNCRESWFDGDRLQNHCEIKEQTVPTGGTVNVDAGRNGGVSVKGWDRNEVLVRAQVQTAATSKEAAESLAKEV